MSCHGDPSAASTAPAATATLTRSPHVALLGSPNVGKSTLFNALTGARQRVMNAPGTTVELQTGTWRLTRRTAATTATLVDLPGTYSLLARSADEQVAADVVTGASTLPAPDVVIVVLEAGALTRSLYLLGQLLAAETAPGESAHPTRPRVVVALTMVDVADARGIRPEAAQLAATLRVPVVATDPRTGAGLEELALAVVHALDGEQHPHAPADAEAEAVFAWVEDVLASLGALRADHAAAATRVTRSDRIDRVLLNPWVGIPVFLAVMWGLFQLATAVAAPVMDAADSLVSGGLAPWVASALEAVGSPSWLVSFVVDGVLAGFATVLSFVPLLAIVFGAIALLEDSGYLARAAVVADRAMAALGLDGRAMLPLVIGFGCNVPALTATRTLTRARSRLLVGLLIPFTSCPARLTVYLLIASAVFPEQAGTAVFLMYVLSIALVVLGGLVLRHTLFRDVRREGLVLALPAYQRPRVGMLARSVWSRCASFVRKAGVIIVGTLSVVWVLMAVPMTPGHAVADVPVADSLYGAAAHAVAPVFEPAGSADWHFSAALATGFVAKEVVVGSFAQTYAVAEPEDPSAPGDLGAQIVATLERTSGGFPALAGAAFMVFVLAYTPCLATLGEQRRLFGWRWTLGATAAQLALAWVLAVAVFRVGVLVAGLLGGGS
ncbi:ferrous iron transporter B [Miniimonas arenae]|uniref:ferrous iron transporter B n=1 Tax=Miniimonas arenae TaxID=676201 RepID=UPI0028AF0EB2|nr:ferrous iron transporter B [Miniimonas arenae]